MARFRTEPELEYHALKMKEYRRAAREKFLATERRSRAKAQLRLGADGIKARNRRYNLWHKYRITPQQYDAMFNVQGGRCAICDAKPQVKNAHGRGHSGRLHIDHDHINGNICALLCHICNQGMIAMDRVDDWATKAIAYVAKYRRA